MIAPSLLLLLCAPAATAVLAVVDSDAATDEGRAHARALRPRLIQQGFAIIPETKLQERLRLYAPGRAALTLEEAERDAAQADQQAMEGELLDAASVLEAVIRRLQEDPLPTPDKAKLTEKSRIQAANWRIGAAGNEGIERGSDPQGDIALALLVDALIANPGLAVDAKRYPPRMRRLLEQARIALQDAGLGHLQLASAPAGAKVFVDGRLLGTTPLDLAGTLPRGPHRVWLVHQGLRSATRVVELGEDKVALTIDLDLEARLEAAPPGINMAGLSWTPGRVNAVLRATQADDLVLVGAWKDQRVAVHLGQDGGVLASASSPLDDGGAHALDVLAEAIAEGRRGPVDEAFTPREPGHDTANLGDGAQDEAEAGFPWLWVGGGAGAGAAVVVVGAAALTATVVALVASGQTTAPVATFSVEVEP